MSYCIECGTKEVKRYSNQYDKDSGKRILTSVCVNTKCYQGCYRNGGHQKSYSFWRGYSACTRCGWQAPC